MTCASGASGTFDATNTTLPVSAGVLLTSGSILVAAQPNLSGGESAINNTNGDPDLDILAGVLTFDACALEFDLTATCDTIRIAYVFGSEEYDEYVCAGVNDAFGFFVTGPGLNNVNIATVPGSATPVSINTVNNGTVGMFGNNGPGCILTNSAYYAFNNGTTYEYDGRTVRMEAKTWVQPGATYHLKLVVADGGDGVLDSGVFLEEGGITGASAPVSITTTSLSGSNYIVEGCTDGLISFERVDDISNPDTVWYTVSGSATNGTDYVQIADSIIFLPGQDSVGLAILGIDDGIPEGLETLEIIFWDSACGLVITDTAWLDIVDPPEADFSSTAACPGQPAQFTDLSTFYGNITNWDWEFGDGGTANTQNPTHIYNSTGTFTIKLVITTAEGCMDSTTQTISVLGIPSAGFSMADFCAGHPTNFTDLSTVNPGDSLTNWDWDFGDGGGSINQNPWHTYFNAGTYTTTLIATNLNGCTDTVAQPVTIYDAPQPEFGWGDVCQEEEMTFTDQSQILSGSIISWAWDLGDGTISSQPSLTHTYQDTGVYTVQLVTVSDQGCIDSVAHDVEVFPNPEPEFDVSFACMGDTSFFTDLSTIASGSIVNWEWDFGDGNVSTDQNPAYLYGAPGTYNVTLTTTSDHGCMTSVVQQIVRGPRPPGPIVKDDSVCFGFSAYLTAHSNWGRVDWYYTPNGGTPFHTGNVYETGPITQKITYYCQVTTPDGCKSDMIGVVAFAHAPPNLQVTVSSYDVEIPSAIVEFNILNQLPGDQYEWGFGDGNGSTAANPVHQYTEEGEYPVTLHAENIHGCITDYELGVVNVTQNNSIYIPNIFSPNGDGLNDEFFVVPLLITDLEIRIFDRWGKVIYHSQDMNFKWDGTVGGQPLPEGAYAYRINAVAFDGEKVEKVGTISIVR